MPNYAPTDREAVAYALLTLVIDEVLHDPARNWEIEDSAKAIENYVIARDALITHSVRPGLVEELISEAKKDLFRRWKAQNV